MSPPLTYRPREFVTKQWVRSGLFPITGVRIYIIETNDTVTRISNRTVRGVEVAYAGCGGRVGRVPGLAQPCTATVSRRLASRSDNSERVGHHGGHF